MHIGDSERHIHDYKRHATTTPFAALEVATGTVKPKHRRQEFLSFLRQIDHDYPNQDLHLVVDNYATYKTAEVCGGSMQIVVVHERLVHHFPGLDRRRTGRGPALIRRNVLPAGMFHNPTCPA